jgi:hypothetical protein
MTVTGSLGRSGAPEEPGTGFGGDVVQMFAYEGVAFFGAMVD